jgi:hypothetical protein
MKIANVVIKLPDFWVAVEKEQEIREKIGEYARNNNITIALDFTYSISGSKKRPILLKVKANYEKANE